MHNTPPIPPAEHDFFNLERISFALQSAQVGLWDFDLTTNSVWLSDRSKELYGFSKDAVVLVAEVLQHLHPEDQTRVTQEFNGLLNPDTAATYDTKFRIVNPADGTVRWLHSKGQTSVDEQGKPYHFAGITLDVTTEEQSRKEFVFNASQWNDLIESSPIATAVYTGREMNILAINEAMISTWAKDSSIVGKDFLEAAPEFEDQPFLELMQKVYDTGEAFSISEGKANVMVNGQLQEFWFSYDFKPLRNEWGEIYGIINTATDITVHVRARQAEADKTQQAITAGFQQSQDWLSRIFSQAPVAIALLEGDDYRISFANESCYEIWQVPFGSVNGEPVFEAFPGMDGLGLQEILDQVRKSGVTHRGNEQHAELIRMGKPETVYINYVYAPIRNQQNEVSIIFVGTEVTSQVLARQQIEKSEERYRIQTYNLQERTEELASSNEHLRASGEELTETNHQLSLSNDRLQRFAYVASHDLQEPLRKIQAFSSLLNQKYAEPLGEQGLSLLTRMSKAGEQMSTLIQDLLTYSRMIAKEEHLQILSLQQVLSNVLDTLELSIQQTGATIEMDVLPTVLGDELQLTQLFQNLLSNAIKFAKPNEKPAIRVTSQIQFREQLPKDVTPISTALRFQQISFIDQGVGFDERFIDRIFEVFQRLHDKQEFAGTGIGLAICQRVVENHGGAITAHSKPGQGATFTVYLPA